MDLKKLTIVRKRIFWAGAIFALIFSTPMLSAMLVFKLSSLLGCSLSAAGASECLFLGIDLGQRFYGYTVPLIGSILSPIAFFFGFWDVMLIWLISIIFITLKIRAISNGG